MASVYIYDPNQFGSVHSWGIACDHAIQVNGVPDMVQKVLDATEGSSNSLYFGGAASENYQSVGAGAERDNSGDRSFQSDEDLNLLGAARVHLPRLADRVNRVYMFNLPERNALSSRLLTAVAQALGTGTHAHSGSHSVINMGPEPTVRRRSGTRAVLQTGELRNRLDELAGQ